ncbi:contact-dependent growth inhibition system immunity protein [Streptomyces atratus]|uniref:contact-dependent growth inhibition system immunity protein n=1 Tax=Streptomyces atratus TaxID=1893 RepID=UPI00340FE407
MLRDNPMAEGDMYAGELLSAVVARTPSAWKASPGLVHELRAIASQAAGWHPNCGTGTSSSSTARRARRP